MSSMKKGKERKHAIFIEIDPDKTWTTCRAHLSNEARMKTLSSFGLKRRLIERLVRDDIHSIDDLLEKMSARGLDFMWVRFPTYKKQIFEMLFNLLREDGYSGPLLSLREMVLRIQELEARLAHSEDKRRRYDRAV